MKNKIKALFVAAVAGMMCVGVWAEDAASAKKPLKVLMIGNSFSICVLKQMPQVAASLNLPLDLCSLYIGGCSLNNHWSYHQKTNACPYQVSWSYTSCDKKSVPVLAAMKQKSWEKAYGFSNIAPILSADKWDVVTLQQASHESWYRKSYEPAGTKLIGLIRQLAPQAKIIVQQTWTYTPWDKRLAHWKIDQNKMFEHLEDAYADFATRHGLEQILMGKAVQLYRKELPVVYTEKSNNDDVCGTDKFVQKDGKWAPQGDVFHLNARGEFLQALVWTAKLFNADVTKSTYLPACLEKQPERAELMRKIAVRCAQQSTSLEQKK